MDLLHNIGPLPITSSTVNFAITFERTDTTSVRQTIAHAHSVEMALWTGIAYPSAPSYHMPRYWEARLARQPRAGIKLNILNLRSFDRMITLLLKLFYKLFFFRYFDLAKKKIIKLNNLCWNTK